ncbi:fanconi anemia group M protein [Wickerhamomyces ciferrii]|uniref:ATP-dependent DNA helicase n=1 Tax=Wickerhamomyces ciferrii (strain ATCC 14091 / BCRC 22168 / CBS 111 / JCM 3599 / NBRC 0793 / NRRL Y-1031 F-60-10) TaxID=1206466 RepID=K0KF43_WICCF|nr:fanconi anemia group M protein [Wickerhamomyces ciferrii]CCH41581.1 fanconi anemia group M protein [Wickerhamomyces ciferrii]
MSEDSFDDDFEDELDEVLNRGAVNRQVQETIIRRDEPAQRTLTGDIIHRDPAEYEEIRREVTYGPTHHKTNPIDMNTFIYPSNLEMRDYQYDIIVKAFYKNLLCAIPTGMGKTFIASTVMLNYYRWFKEGKIIFMAPTRPLVAQQIQACLGVTDIPSGDTAILLDKTRKNRPEIWNSKRVFFTTPQVVENDLKTGILNPKEIVCLVIDEAHRARGNYAYTNVVQFVERFNTSYRVLALTATPAADIEGVQEVVNNLHISQIEIRTEESIDIVKYMKRKETVRINVGLNSEMEDIIELLSEAIDPVLKQANEAHIYEVTDPGKINAFQVMQKSQAIIKNPTLNEGIKWKYYFILQVIGYVGQMLRRLKIYGVRTFYSYFQNKCKEFRTKYSMGKSTNKTSAGFFYHDALKKIERICDSTLADPSYVSHPKLEHMIDELMGFFQHNKKSRVIVFTELRESALEIVKCIDAVAGDECKAHIFIGQSKAKEGFDEEEYTRKNAPKGRGKQKKQEREEREREALEKKQRDKELSAAERKASRTATSEEAQLQGMNQKTQKELIKKFKNGDFNVLVATSIGEEGLDIGEVDLIICYDSTSSPIKNIQRMGRTGRKNNGKVILLLASNEELKFDQAMEGYAFVQKQIAQDCLDTHKSDRIIPKEIQPRCLKKLIEVPEENLAIAKGEDEDEVIKYATQAMLGKNVKGKKSSANSKSAKQGKLPGLGKAAQKKKEAEAKRPKRFFMPDKVETGFVKSSKLVKKVGEPTPDTSREASISLDSDCEGDISSHATKSKNNSRVSNISTTKSSNTSKNVSFNTSKNTNTITNASKRKSGSFLRPDVNAEDENIRRHYSESEDSESEIEILKDGNTNSKVSKIKNSTDIAVQNLKPYPTKNILEDIIDASDDDDLFAKQLTPEYEKADFLASSPKEQFPKDNGQNSELDDEIIDSDDEVSEIKDPSHDQKTHGETTSGVKTSTPLKRLSDNTSSANKRSKQEVQGDVLDSLLSFKAYESDQVEYNGSLSIQPYKEAEKVMEKQYDNDPSFVEDSLSDQENNKGGKRKATKGSAKKKSNKQAEVPIETPSKLDITKLLKEGKKSKLIKHNKVVDLSVLSNDQIVDLDDEFGSQNLIKKNNEVIPKRKQRSTNIQYYLSQNDTIAKNEFMKNEGFLTESQKRLFFSEYYSSVEVDDLNLNPTLDARRGSKTFGIGHSRVSQRFSNLVGIIRSPKGRSLNKLINQFNSNKDIRFTDVITDNDGIVGEDEIEYVDTNIRKEPIPIELDDESEGEDSVLDNERPGGPGFTSISLLSDDDDEFKSL